MKKFLTTIALIALTSISIGAEQANVITVQTDGISMHNKKPPVDGWLALLDGKNAQLKQARLKLKQRRSTRIGETYDDLDAWASTVPQAQYLLRHDSLAAGNVISAKLPDFTKISDASDKPGVTLLFGNSKYTFGVRNIDPKNAGLRRIVVTANGATTLLYDWRSSHSTNDNMELVRWAGDLDGDGKLDFIIEFTTYASYDTCLFLSGQAKPPALVKRVGCHFTSG